MSPSPLPTPHSPFPTPHSPFPIPHSRNDLHRSFHREHLKQLFYLVIFKRYASQRPIVNRSERFSVSAAVNEDVSAKSCVLRRLRPGANGAHYGLMLGL